MTIGNDKIDFFFVLQAMGIDLGRTTGHHNQTFRIASFNSASFAQHFVRSFCGYGARIKHVNFFCYRSCWRIAVNAASTPDALMSWLAPRSAGYASPA